MKKAAIYIMVSTTDQETGLQENELREFADRRGWEYQIFTDRGQSGAKDVYKRQTVTAPN